MATHWERELALALRLCAGWLVLARQAEPAGAASPNLAQVLHGRVLKPFRAGLIDEKTWKGVERVLPRLHTARPESRRRETAVELVSRLQKYVDDEAAGAIRPEQYTELQKVAGQQEPAPEELLELWLGQARAVAEWRRLSAECRWDDSAAATTLAEQCSQLVTAIDERNQRARLLSWLLPAAAADRVLFDAAREALENSRQRCLEVIGPPPSAARGADGAEALPAETLATYQRIEANLHQAAGWPPLFLAELAADEIEDLLDRLPAAVKVRGMPRFPSDESRVVAGARLAFSLAQVLDTVTISDEICTTLKTHFDEMLSATDSKVVLLCKPELGGSTNSSKVEQRQEADLTEPRVEQTGVTAQVKGTTYVVRKQIVRVPLPPAPPRAALLRVADWLAGPGHDLALAVRCRDLAAEIAPALDLDTWWAKATGEARAQLWLCLQALYVVTRISPDPGPALAALAEFQNAGIVLHLGRPNDDAAAPAGDSHVWLLSSQATSKLMPAVRGPILRGPDGRDFGPVLWLCPLATPTGGSPLADYFAGHAHVFATWWQRDAGWPGWTRLQTIQEELRQPPPRARAVRLGLDTLQLLYERVRTCPDENSDVIRSLLTRLQTCLKQELQAEPLPALDPDRLEPQALAPKTPPPPGTELRWEKGGIAGQVLAVEQFGARGIPARLRLAAGETGWEGAAPWWPLGEPPRCEGGQDVPLRATLHEIRHKAAYWLWDPEREKKLQQLRDRLVRELEQSASLKYFNDLVRLARRASESGEGEAVAAAGWVMALRQSNCCGRLFPRPGDRGGDRWPVDEAPDGPSLQWRFDERVPFGTVLGDVQAYGATPEQAQCVISQGPRAEPLAAAVDMVHTGAATPGLAKPLRDLLVRTRQAVWKGEDLAPVPILEPVLQELDRLDVTTDEAALTALLPLLKRWCAYHDLDVVPATPSGAPVLPTGTGPAAPLLQPHFDPRPPGHLCGVTSYGLRRRQTANWERRCELRLSVGPKPPGYDDLRRLLPQDVAAILHATLDGWTQTLDLARTTPEKLPYRVEQFFVAYWEVAPLLPQGRQPEVQEALAAFLEHYGYFMDWPREMDYRDKKWQKVERPANATASFGVVRPRLVDAKGNQKVAPVVWCV